MVKKYTAKIKYTGKKKSAKKSVSRMEMAAKNSPRAKSFAAAGRGNKHRLRRFHLSKKNWQNLRKIGLIFLGVLFVVGVVGSIWVFSYVQQLDSELPSADEPFGSKETASVIYDRNGKELYRLYDEYNRDPVNIDEIPYAVRWSFLAAEDVDFYTHDGFDAMAILRCAIINTTSGVTQCGGSTVTQQMVKITTLTNEQSIERKLKELLMSTRVEQAYSKDEILELYLTVAPFGNNVYGITSAAEVYYGKEPKDLTLAEAAVLAGIIQSPAYNSPTLALDPEEGLRRSEIRKEYILGQLLEKKDKINEQHRRNINDPEAEDLITEEIIEEAKTQELVYVKPRFGYKPVAGHFVDYVTQVLTERNYKTEEEPFSTAELQTGGYKIYTTLDLDLQKIAESSVSEAVSQEGSSVGAANAALVTLMPESGEVLAMVGSKDYNGGDEGCDSNGANCRFNGQVNNVTSRHSPGSSTKPHGYYEAFRQGAFYPGSFLPDIPITVDGYELQNWNAKYIGAGANTSAAEMLRQSRNLPAIIIVDTIGVEAFLNVMRDFGYSTYENSANFGASVILGGADVLPIEHAQGYGVFANGGDFVQHEVVLKIEDRDGNIVYEHEPERERVADPKAVYLLNQSINNNYNLAAQVWGSNDLADKTGTSEEHKDVWLAAYSPDMVTVGWMGNNNNDPMASNAFGASTAKPWVSRYLSRISGSTYFSEKTAFQRPGGIVRGGGCSGDCEGEIVGVGSHYMIEGYDYAVDNIRQTVEVCTDQQAKLAREVDKQLGKSTERLAYRWILAKANLQADLDKYVQDKFGLPNKIPDEECDVDRASLNFLQGTGAESVNGNSQVRVYGGVLSSEGNITSLEAYVDFVDANNPGRLLGNVAVNTDGTFDATLNYPGNVEPGTYAIGLVATDTSGADPLGIKLQTLVVKSETTTNLKLRATPNFSTYTWGNSTGDIGEGKNITLTLNYSGAGGNGYLNSVTVYVRKNGGSFSEIGRLGDSPGFSASWGGEVANEDAVYEFYLTATTANGGQLKSAIPVGLQVEVEQTP